MVTCGSALGKLFYQSPRKVGGFGLYYICQIDNTTSWYTLLPLWSVMHSNMSVLKPLCELDWQQGSYSELIISRMQE